MKHAFVVMQNDFPVSVFSTEEKAAAFCTRMIEETKGQRPKSYWKHYCFLLDLENVQNG